MTFECLIFPVICCLIRRPKWLFWPGVRSRFDSGLSVNYQRARVAFPKSMAATGLCTFETLTPVLRFVLSKFDLSADCCDCHCVLRAVQRFQCHHHHHHHRHRPSSWTGRVECSDSDGCVRNRSFSSSTSSAHYSFSLVSVIQSR